MKPARFAPFLALAILSSSSAALAAPKAPARKPAAPAASAAAPDQAPAAEDEPEVAEDDKAGAPTAIPLNPRSGKVTLKDGLATIDVPAAFGYLSPEETETLLVKAWGNPPGNDALGMIIPADFNLGSEDAWGVIITYQADGHVSDEDAEKIDYSELLNDMKEGVKEENQERTKGGFDTADLIGWAEPPRYDKGAKKLYWAKELHFGQAATNTLNYNVRVLGKDGVLVLNAVAGMNQLGLVTRDMKEVIGFTQFADGHRYDEFDPKTDKVAAYGIAALVAGGVAAKTGLFKGLLLMLLAGKKAVVGGLAVIGGAIAKVFKRKGSGVQNT
jgi:uncharacterized membrane-anchored protein